MLDDLGASIALAQQAMSASQPGYGTRVARETFDQGSYYDESFGIPNVDQGYSYDPNQGPISDPYTGYYDPSFGIPGVDQGTPYDPNMGPLRDPNMIYEDPSGGGNGGGGGWGKTLGNALGGIGRGLAGGFSAAASALSQQARDRIAAQNALKEAIARRGGPSAQTQGGTTQPLNLTGSAAGVKASPLARYSLLLQGLK